MTDEIKKEDEVQPTKADRYANFITNQRQNDIFTNSKPTSTQDIGIVTGKISKDKE